MVEHIDQPRTTQWSATWHQVSLRQVQRYLAFKKELEAWLMLTNPCDVFRGQSRTPNMVKKGKASSLDIAPLTILNSGTFTTLELRKWQLTGNERGTAAHAVAAQSLC